jgi:hypothetical protein
MNICEICDGPISGGTSNNLGSSYTRSENLEAQHKIKSMWYLFQDTNSILMV